MSEIEPENVFSYLSDDVVLNIFFKLVDDPRNWSRLACVCTKFSSLIRTICWKTKCHQAIPAVVSDLIPANSSESSAVGGGWASLHKLAVCCPGLVHSGVLLENSDFGLERDLGPDENYPISSESIQSNPSSSSSRINGVKPNLFQSSKSEANPSSSTPLDDKINGVKSNFNGSDCSWSLYDDLYLDTVYNNSSKSHDQSDVRNEDQNPDPNPDPKHDSSSNCSSAAIDDIKQASDFSICKKRRICRSLTSHLASEAWNFSREQGNKLLASRFRGDCLYICDWPGCVHTEEKRNYMLFRGVFKNFKRSRVWRTINDGNRRSKIDLNCAFCPSDEVWELHSAFCLRPAYGFHDDGEPVVRAYVCENGHVSGAWTDWPLYT